MQNRKGLRWATVGIVLLFIAMTGIVYIHEKFFFNPLTFRNDVVVYMPWNWYTSPLKMQIASSTSSNGPVMVSDAHQIHYVISELEKGSTLQTTATPKLPGDSTYAILIATPNHGDVQLALLFPKEKLVQISTRRGDINEREFISLRPGLLTYVEKTLRQ